MNRLFAALGLAIASPLAALLLDSFWPYVAFPFTVGAACWIVR